jgi:hypothetical protein
MLTGTGQEIGHAGWVQFSIRALRASMLAAWLLGTPGTHSAWAQGPSVGKEEEKATSAKEVPDQQTTDGTESAGTEGSRQEPRFLPPGLRPRQLTPEEQEDAERLKKLAAKYGTDPTAIVGRVQLSSQYADLPRGARLSDTVLRVDLPYRKNWLLRMDLPFVRWSDPGRPGTTSARGLSDLAAALGWRAYNTPEYALFAGVLATFPTSSRDDLGSEKYTVGPLVATARFLPRWESFLFGVFQHLTSVGGDPARRDISLTRATMQINTIWHERWWTTVQGIWQIDWQRSGKSSMTLELEAGRNVIGRWGVFLRPGVGVWGRDVVGAYDWNVEAGVRYVFASF